MKAEQINSIVNKIKDMGLEDYIIFYTDYEVEGIIRMKSDTTVAVLDDANECICVLETNANPIAATMNEKPLFISFADYDHVTSVGVMISAEELKENKDKFNFEDEDIKRVVKAVTGFGATGYLREKGTGKLPKVPGMAVDFEMGVPYKPYVPQEPDQEEDKESEPVEEPVVEEPTQPVNEDTPTETSEQTEGN
jgi:hypothetical protein